MDDTDGGAREMGSRGASTPWQPLQLVFKRYIPPNGSDFAGGTLRATAKKKKKKKSVVVRLTNGLVETYKICNPQFKYRGELNPKRYLTTPSVGVLNDGFDNVNSDLILAVNDDLSSSDSRQRYIVKDLLGHGTFGQVAKCWVPETNSFVAVKVIKNQPAYYQQALVEVSILTTLNKKYDPEDKHHIVRIYDYFLHQRHLCICFELLDMNLYELIKINQFRGLSLSIVQLFSKQILLGLALLKDAGIIHCDLKPENILLCASVKPTEIKIIDFGSACMEDRTVYSYIQSRYYRSPEVLLGHQYTTAIDMWSFGCIVAELFLGLPLFPGASEFDIMRRMIEILGKQPPDYVLKEAKNANKFFKCVGSVHNFGNGGTHGGLKSAYMALTEEEFEAREKKKPDIGKEYFRHKNLEEIVKGYPYKINLPEDDVVKETQIRLALIDFLRGLVEFDPAKRWSPFQAAKHPFITGEPFTCPYNPPPETPHVHVAQNFKVDHHPGGGHWFAAGLSPHASGRTRIPMHNSPHFQMIPPYSHANSYGSIGSYGSYNDGAVQGSSYGSYGDNGNMVAYYSPVNHTGLYMQNRGGVPMVGTSPDARRRVMQYPHGNGLGTSPSAGNFAPLPLGTSPSQFTPPNPNNQYLAGSPGHHGPTSPARNSCHGSPLGKMAAFSQFNRRQSVGYSGGSQSQDSSLSQAQGHGMDNLHQNINTSSPLSIGQTLSSPGGFYELGFFSPNNTRNLYVGIWFKEIVPRVVVWVANRDKPVTNSAANLTISSSNGSLILLDGKQDVIWSTGEAFTSNKCHAELQDTGNLVVIDDVTRKTLWQSFENLGDTMVPQSSLMYDLSLGKKRVLTSWKSNSDPSPGGFSLEITAQVPLQGLIRRGSAPYWRTGPWAKTRFTGFPQFDESYVSPFSVVQDLAAGAGSFSYSTLRNFNLSYITLTPEGEMKIYWDQGKRWMHHVTEPEHSCDLYGTCGPYGLCVRSSTPKCICVKGFVPKSDEEWRKRNWTSGCVRRKELSCLANSQGKDTDVFYHMNNVKTPDMHQFVSFLDAEMCYQGCLGNCSCTAFAYISGIGCLVWNGKLVDTVQFLSNGETLSLRLARSELAGSSRTKIIVGAITSLSIVAILIFTAFMFWRYRGKQNDAWKDEFEPQDISGVNFFQMHTIRTATNNFSSSNKLGQGGFGPVYKGILLDGKEIAVKRLSSSSGQGTEEFMNEITLISKLQHRNLVRLLGYCIEREEKLLIYEFMVNKSLDIFLFDPTLKLEIEWPKRFNIIQGIARGLLYLHRDSRLRVIHRDLKVSNILLDEEMNPKISDFGLARMFQGTQFQYSTQRVAGTLGYMSPEYAWAGLFSEMSDIYSFGVLMLEIISGEKISRFTFGDERKGLVAYAWESWCESGGFNLLDRDLNHSCKAYEVSRCVQVGLLCVQHEAADRPNTLQVMSMITSTTDLPIPKQPIFAVQTQNVETSNDVSTMSKDLFSVNDLTHSVIQGR